MKNLIKVDKFDKISYLDDGGYGFVFKVESNDYPPLALKVLKNEKREWAIKSFYDEFMVM